MGAHRVAEHTHLVCLKGYQIALFRGHGLHLRCKNPGYKIDTVNQKSAEHLRFFRLCSRFYVIL